MLNVEICHTRRHLRPYRDTDMISSPVDLLVALAVGMASIKAAAAKSIPSDVGHSHDHHGSDRPIDKTIVIGISAAGLVLMAIVVAVIVRWRRRSALPSGSKSLDAGNPVYLMAIGEAVDSLPPQYAAYEALSTPVPVKKYPNPHHAGGREAMPAGSISHKNFETMNMLATHERA